MMSAMWWIVLDCVLVSLSWTAGGYHRMAIALHALWIGSRASGLERSAKS